MSESETSEINRCLGIASGGRCDLDAGYGTDDSYLCHYHEDQEVEEIAGLFGEALDVHGFIIGKDPIDMGQVEGYETTHIQTTDGFRFEANLTLLSEP